MGDVKYSYFKIQNEAGLGPDSSDTGEWWKGFMMIESEMSRQVSDMININITVL